MGFTAVMTVTGIKGTVRLEGHQDKISVMSFQHGVDWGGIAWSDSGERKKGRGRVDHQDFSVTKPIDIASAELALACCKAKVLDEVKIEILEQHDEDSSVIAAYTLEKVIISSIYPCADPKLFGNLPFEVLTMNYRKITWENAQVAESGKVQSGPTHFWDVVSNSGG